MNGGSRASGWRFFKFALFVTGKGERAFLPKLFRSLEEGGHCHFRVVHRLGQLSPIRSEKRQLRMLGRGQRIPDGDAEIGLQARRYLSSEYDYLLLVDDLERDRAEDSQAVYDRYRKALDEMLSPMGLEGRASVHFLTNMLEAYYFADTNAVNSVLGTGLSDFAGDVETISHPKNNLKAYVAGLGPGRSFDEVRDGGRILQALDLEKVLSRPDACRSLRTSFAWCQRAMGVPPTERFRLTDGQLSPITAPQLDRLPPILG